MSSIEKESNCQNSCDTLDGEYIAYVRFSFPGKLMRAEMLSINNVYTIVSKFYGNMSADTVGNLLQYSKHLSNDFEEVVLQFSNNSRIKIFKDTTVNEKYFLIISKNNDKKIKEGVSDDFNLQRYIEESLKI